MHNNIKTNITGLNSFELDDSTGAVFDIVWKKRMKID